MIYNHFLSIDETCQNEDISFPHYTDQMQSMTYVVDSTSPLMTTGMSNVLITSMSWRPHPETNHEHIIIIIETE